MFVASLGRSGAGNHFACASWRFDRILKVRVGPRPALFHASFYAVCSTRDTVLLAKERGRRGSAGSIRRKNDPAAKPTIPYVI